jgi:hypothetical protein
MPHLPPAHHETSKRDSSNERKIKEKQNKTIPDSNSNIAKSMTHHNQTKELTTWFLRFSEQNMIVGEYSGVTIDPIVDERPSLPPEANVNVSAEQHNSVGYNNHDIETGPVNNDAPHPENGHFDRNREPLDHNPYGNSTEEPLEKTRTYVFLLAILAVSLTYQSGLNLPGGFWSNKVHGHSAGDRILEDNNHARFIAFYYLNLVAFAASVVIILMLLSKSISEKVTKHRVLQIVMIVDLLSLTGAFVMGSCREAKKSIYTSVLVCLVLAYVALHVLIAIHLIPPEWKRRVSEKLEQFSCGNLWSALCHRQTGNTTTMKELERRRNLLLTISILAATVTYQAGINPPGGV